MTNKPDSSLAILLAMDGNSMITNSMRARYALLLSMALDKNYIDITDDSLAKVASSYYQHHGSVRYRMLSAYYLGVVHQNAGDNIKAAVEFDKALSLAKELNDNHNAGLASRHLSTIYDINYNHLQALEYARQAVTFFENCGETLSADYARLSVAEQLSRNKEWKQSLEIAENILANSSSEALLRKALWIKTDILSVRIENYSEALNCLETIPLRAQRSDSLSYYEYKGFLLETQGLSSESKKHFDKAESLLNDAIDSLTFLERKSESYRIHGDYRNAYTSLRKATEIQYQEIEVLLEQSVSCAMENYFRESWKHEQDINRIRTILFALSVIAFIFIIAFLIGIVRKQRKNRIKDLADIESLNNDILLLKSNNKVFREVNDAVFLDKVRFLQSLSDAYFSWTDESIRKKEIENGIQTQDEIISLFRKQLGELRSDKQLTNSLESAINTTHNGVLHIIKSEFSNKLKEQDYITITYFLSGLSIKSIAFLLRTSEAALRTRKTRYKQLFEQNPRTASIQL